MDDSRYDAVDTLTRPRFHVCTIVNKPEQYAEMREAFAKAGFSEGLSRFSTFDNSLGNRHDPYRVLSTLIAETSEQYLIFCHQDVRPNLGHSAADLCSALERLDKIDRDWVVAGNAGVDLKGKDVLHLDDPHGRFRAARLPRQVVSLDENFLVIKPQCGVSTSAELDGFHLYATDLILNAKMQQKTAYVIDFLLTHLSAGKPSTRKFAEAKARLEQTWRQRLWVGLIQTTTRAGIYVSRVPLIERFLRRRVVRTLLWFLGISLVSAKVR